MEKRKNRKTIAVTDQEFALLSESRELFTRFTKAKISWGAYLCALSLGGIAAKSLNGIVSRCPDCGHGVVMTLENPMGQHLKSLPREDPKV
jgi:hypothetical protein